MIYRILKFLKENWLIILIWIFGLFLRTYRQGDLLGFYYDNGRDAKMAQDIITGRNFPAIGPTTGIQGLFLGPFWYYLITPGYLIGGGNPAIASWFVGFIESLTIPALYILLKNNFSKHSGLLAAFFWSFSNYLLRSSRWFSNPSPIPFFVVALIYFLLKIFKEKKTEFWPVVFLLLGLSLQLEAASAVFFIPVIVLISLVYKKITFSVKLQTWIRSVLVFLVLLIPQAAFEIKNGFITTKNLLGFLSGKVNSDSGKSWAIPTLDFAVKRIHSYYEIFFSKLDTNTTWVSVLFLILLLSGLIFLCFRYKNNKLFVISFVWLFLPLLLLLFFVGNYGYLYDYYLTGFFPAFVILFVMSLSAYKTKFINYLLIIASLMLFLKGNYIYVRDYLKAGVDGPTHITLGNEKLALEEICRLSGDQSFNLEIYVPPIVPHSYEYLLSWYQKKNICRQPSNNPENNIFVLYEVDTANPKNLSNWLQRIDTIGKITKEQQFGGIYIQQRQRIK